jgi:hypothetical protein
MDIGVNVFSSLWHTKGRIGRTMAGGPEKLLWMIDDHEDPKEEDENPLVLLHAI